MLKVGDKVRFLNAVGGGLVKEIKDRNIVVVEDEDGFDVPVDARELVVVDEAQDQRMQRNETQHRSRSGNTTTSMRQLLNQDLPDDNPSQSESIATSDTPSEIFTADLDSPRGEFLNVSLFVSPHAGEQPERLFDLYLLNDSNFHLFYVLSTRVGEKCSCRNCDTAEPHVKVLVATIQSSDLDSWEHILVQLLAYKPSAPYAAKPTFSIPVRLSGPRLFMPGTYSDNEFFEQKVLAIPLVSDDVPHGDTSVDIHPQQLASTSDSMPLDVADSDATTAPQSSHEDFIALPKLAGVKIVAQPDRKYEDVPEVNLNAAALFDNLSDIDTSSILSAQIDRFRQEMEKAQRRKGMKILFRIAASDDALHHAIVRILKLEYPASSFRDADVREFGRGAVLVTIG